MSTTPHFNGDVIVQKSEIQGDLKRITCLDQKLWPREVRT
jgi:hypothetical protein